MSNATTVQTSRTKLRALCEVAIFVAIAVVLDQIRLNILPQGGSVSFVLVPLTFLSIRWGVRWGLIAGLAFGLIKAIVGGGFAWGWQSILLDYFVAFTVIGLAGLFYRRAGGWAIVATVVAGLAQYVVFLLSGVIIWGEWMPDEFLGMAMGNTWFYSLLYNGLYMVPNTLIGAVIIGILAVPLKKYFRGEDLVQA